MKKTLLATMVAATLAMTGCGEKKGNNATDLQTAFDLGQRFSQLNADIADAPTTGNTAQLNETVTDTTTTQLIAFVDAEVEALEGVANPSANQISKLGRFKKYQEDFENIQTKLTEYEEMVEKTSLVAAANNAKMDAAFTAIETTLNEGDTAFTLGDINGLVNKLHNIVKLERVAAEDESAKAVFENVLQAKYEEANKTFDEKFAYAGSDESLVKKTPEFVALLSKYLTDISEDDAKATTLVGDLTYTTNVKKLYDALRATAALDDTKYGTDFFNKYLKGISAGTNTSVVDNAAMLKRLAQDTPETNMSLAPTEVKAIIENVKNKAVSAYLITQFRHYEAPTDKTVQPVQVNGIITAGNEAEMTKLLKNLKIYVDGLTASN